MPQLFYSKNGFTLIELLIGVTFSAILMASIIVFVGSSLGSNMTTKKILEERSGNEKFEQRLTEALGNITGSGFYATGSAFNGKYLTGILIATEKSNLPMTFLGLKTQTGYCDSYSGTASETGTVLRLALRQFITPTVQNTTGYTLSLTGNAIYSGTTRIIGTGYPGNALTNSGIDTELSSPNALISSGGRLYIADTMNDRILSYNAVSGGITKLLGRENGIRKPTSLYFSWNTLLIASSGNGNIYSLQDGESSGSAFSSIFRVSKNFSANTLVFSFSGIPSIVSPTLPASFTLSGAGIVQSSSNDLVATGSSLQYTFSWATPFFITGNLYEFTVKNISPVPTGPGNYSMRIDFQSGSTIQYSDVFHYYAKWDGSLEDSRGNILRVLSGSFIYPHNITGADSWSGTIDKNTVFANNPPGWEIFSYLPVQDLSFRLTDNILTVRYHEYRKYDCISGKHQIEEKIWKISLR